MANDHPSSRRRITTQRLNEESDAFNQNATRQQGKHRSSQIAADLQRRRAALVAAGFAEVDSGQPIEQMSMADRASLDARYRALEQPQDALPSAPTQGPTRTGQTLDTSRQAPAGTSIPPMDRQLDAFWKNVSALPKEDQKAVLQLATRNLPKKEGTKLVDPEQERRVAMNNDTGVKGARFEYLKGEQTGRGDGSDPNYSPGKTLGKVAIDANGKVIGRSTFTKAQSDAHDTKPVVNQGSPQQSANLPMADQQKIMTDFPEIGRAGTKANEIFVADYKKSNNPAEAMDIARNAVEAAAMDDPADNAKTDALSGMEYDKQQALKKAALGTNTTASAPAREGTLAARANRILAPKPALPAQLNTGQEIGKTVRELPGAVSRPIAEGVTRGAGFIEDVWDGVMGRNPQPSMYDPMKQPAPSPEYTAIKQQRAAPITQPRPLQNVATPNPTPAGLPGAPGVPQANINPSPRLSQPPTSAVPNSPAMVPSLDEEARKKAVAATKPLQFNYA